MDITVVIPLYNEEESLPELHAWIKRVMENNQFSYEIIFINDGSTDHSWNVIEDLAHKDSNVKGIKFRRNYGKSPALYCGFAEAEGDVVITMDADLQDSPDEIPELYRMIKEENYDLVSGYKQKRYDPLSKTLPTKLFNATARKISGIHNLHDFNCGLKAYKKDVVKNIEVYGEMHRYIPYLAKNAGFDRIAEKVVQHQARKYGKSKFGLNRFFNGYLDLITLWFLSNFGKKPMHVFGFLGSLMFFIGFIAVVCIGADKAYALFCHIPQRLITDSPYFFIALTMMLLGSQFFLAGFIGDLISRQNPNKDSDIMKENPSKLATYSIGLLTVILILVGCSTIDCSLNNRVICKYKLAGEIKTLNSKMTITANLHNGNDSVIINQAEKTDSFELPMSYSMPIDTFYIDINGTTTNLRDTIAVTKTDIPHFESVDCSPAIFHKITAINYTQHAIDSIVINNPNVTNNVTKSNFFIYFKSADF